MRYTHQIITLKRLRQLGGCADWISVYQWTVMRKQACGCNEEIRYMSDCYRYSWYNMNPLIFYWSLKNIAISLGVVYKSRGPRLDRRGYGEVGFISNKHNQSIPKDCTRRTWITKSACDRSEDAETSPIGLGGYHPLWYSIISHAGQNTYGFLPCCTWYFYPLFVLNISQLLDVEQL